MSNVSKSASNEAAVAKAPWYAKLKNPNTILLIIGIVAVALISILVPKFLTFRNISDVIVQASNTGLMAIGLTFVIITAGIDLSLPTVMGLSAILGCMVMQALSGPTGAGMDPTLGSIIGALTILGIGGVVGCINGFSVAKLKMVPMIVTLAISTIALGTSNWVTGASSVAALPPFKAIFASNVISIPILGAEGQVVDTFIIPMQAIILIVVALIMHVLLAKTVFGRHLFQVGVNENTAKVNGVKTVKVVFLIYLICSLMAGLAGIIGAAKLGAAGPSMGPQDKFMDVVCATVLGGASVMGGKGTIIGTLIGSLFMAVIVSVMNLLNVDFFLTYVVKGGIIIIVTYIDVLRNKLTESR